MSLFQLRRRFAACLFAASCTIGFGIAGIAGAQSVPSPTALLAAHDSLIGGRAALETRTSMRVVGTLTIPMAGIEAPFEILRRKPDTYFFSSSLGQMGEMLQGYDGTTAWAVQPGQPPAILEGPLKDQIVKQADFFADFHDGARFSSMTTVGEVDFEGRRCYEVRMTRLDGSELTEYFDVATGLSAGGVSSADTPMGRMQQVSVHSDYKEFEGVRFATRIVQRNPQYEVILSIQLVEFDKVDSAAVALPESVRALIRKDAPQ